MGRYRTQGGNAERNRCIGSATAQPVLCRSRRATRLPERVGHHHLIRAIPAALDAVRLLRPRHGSRRSAASTLVARHGRHRPRVGPPRRNGNRRRPQLDVGNQPQLEPARGRRAAGTPPSRGWPRFPTARAASQGYNPGAGRAANAARCPASTTAAEPVPPGRRRLARRGRSVDTVTPQTFRGGVPTSPPRST